MWGGRCGPGEEKFVTKIGPQWMKRDTVYSRILFDRDVEQGTSRGDRDRTLCACVDESIVTLLSVGHAWLAGEWVETEIRINANNT